MTPAGQVEHPQPTVAPTLTWRSALGVVVAGAAVVGGLTPFGQRYLPDALTSLANSAGSWTVLTFALVYLSRSRTWLAAILGAVSFVVMNEAYGVVSDLRGNFYSAPFGNVFALVAIVAGPVVGFAASLVRSPVGLWRALGCAVPAAVLVGEGVYGLTLVADTTSPVYWWIELVTGVAVASLVPLRIGVRASTIATGLFITAAGAFAFYVFYGFVLWGPTSLPTSGAEPAQATAAPVYRDSASAGSSYSCQRAAAARSIRVMRENHLGC